MRVTVAIDPGEFTGWARLADGHLTHCGVVRFSDIVDSKGWWPIPSSDVRDVVIEVPRYYPNKNKVDPNDLISLALKAGEAAGHYRDQCEQIHFVPPRTWKGGVDKEIHHRRLLRSVLTLAEVEMLPRVKVSKKNPHGHDNNLLDAVGLGMWFAGRTGVGGT